jgi:hypothetical protein
LWHKKTNPYKLKKNRLQKKSANTQVDAFKNNF